MPALHVFWYATLDYARVAVLNSYYQDTKKRTDIRIRRLGINIPLSYSHVFLISILFFSPEDCLLPHFISDNFQNQSTGGLKLFYSPFPNLCYFFFRNGKVFRNFFYGLSVLQHLYCKIPLICKFLFFCLVCPFLCFVCSHGFGP